MSAVGVVADLSDDSGCALMFTLFSKTWLRDRVMMGIFCVAMLTKGKRKKKKTRVSKNQSNSDACPIGEPFYAKGWPRMRIQSSRADTIQYLTNPINLLIFE